MDIIKDPYICLYFYSAVFQGNMALLALTGVFAIFRYQAVQSSIQAIEVRFMDFIREFIHKFIPGEELYLNFSSVENLKLSLDELSKKYPNLKDVKQHINHLYKLPNYEKALYQREILLKSIFELKTNVRKPLLSTICIIILSLVLLPLGYNINKIDSCFLEELLILITILINIYVLYTNAKFIMSTLKS